MKLSIFLYNFLILFFRIDQLESEIHEHSDLRTSEFTRLKQDIDQQWNMVSLREKQN